MRTTSTRCIKVIAHLHDDVTRALHAGICSQEKNKMMARSGGGFTCCVPGCFTNNERDPHLSFYVFPKKKKLRRRWLHSISRKSFKPTAGHRVCSLHFKGEKNLHEQCSCFFFPSAKSHPRRPPEPRRKLTVNKSSTSNQETQPSPSLPASTTTSKADESERDCQEIRRLREERANVLRLKGSLERICPSLNLV